MEELADSLESASHRPRIAAVLIQDEPLTNATGFQSEVLWEALYQCRSHAPELPLAVNEEATLGYLGVLGDAVDLWLDDSYYDRGTGHGGRTPLCEYILAIKDAHRRDRPYRAVGMYQLAGWEEDSVYHKASPDLATCQSLAGLAIGVEAQMQWRRFDGSHDLAARGAGGNKVLWDAYGPGGTISLLDRVGRYVNESLLYAADLGPTGVHTDECEYPPVAYRYGCWQREGNVGTYFVFANLDEFNEYTITLSWTSDLHLPVDSPPVTLDLDGWSTGVTAANVTINQLGSVSFRVPSAGYIVGRLSHYAPLASVEMSIPTDGLDLRVLGNPATGPAQISLLSAAGLPLDVRVFDAAGREVRRLFDGLWSRRADVLEWDGRDGSGRACGSGVYFVRAVAAYGQRKTATLVRLP
jgi:hypothetical protein